MIHHRLRVRADGVIALRRRDAMAVLQHGIERDAVVLLRQILADRGEMHTVAVQLAEDAVMIPTPGQDPLLRARDRLEHGTCAAAELHAKAAHETAREVS